MMLRPRQKEMVGNIVAALKGHDNTLAIAPTGAGKTVMLSAALSGLFKGNVIGNACVLQHRDELVSQNRRTFRALNPDIATGIFNAEGKSWEGNVTFAMVQTLARQTSLATMPRLDALVIDEAHHARAESYMRIIEQAKAGNPDCKLLGVTATPLRGDKKGLRSIFDNVCDRITVSELIRSGHLVPPRTFVMDVGVQAELNQIKETALDYDMGQVAEIMDKRPINQAVVRHWKEKAGERQTVVFCSTLAHAAHVAASFDIAGIKTALVHGDLSEDDRRQLLADYAAGTYQVIVNVAVLTEGWDHPPTSCVVLLRPSSHKSTMIQMIGRGLRTIDPEKWPGITKTDCIVLDFGTSTIKHGSIEQAAGLEEEREQKPAGDKQVIYKTCPDCQAEIPARSAECSLCGYSWKVEIQPPENTEIADFGMREIHILRNSAFLWCDAFRNESTLVAGGFRAWGAVIQQESGHWQALGGLSADRSTKHLAHGDKALCLAAANDWLNLHETEDNAHKTRNWLYEPATPKQLQYLPKQFRHDYALTRYEASALLTLKFNQRSIQQIAGSAA